MTDFSTVWPPNAAGMCLAENKIRKTTYPRQTCRRWQLRWPTQTRGVGQWETIPVSGMDFAAGKPLRDRVSNPGEKVVLQSWPAVAFD